MVVEESDDETPLECLCGSAVTCTWEIARYIVDSDSEIPTTDQDEHVGHAMEIETLPPDADATQGEEDTPTVTADSETLSALDYKEAAALRDDNVGTSCEHSFIPFGDRTADFLSDRVLGASSNDLVSLRKLSGTFLSRCPKGFQQWRCSIAIRSSRLDSIPAPRKPKPGLELLLAIFVTASGVSPCKALATPMRGTALR